MIALTFSKFLNPDYNPWGGGAIIWGLCTFMDENGMLFSVSQWELFRNLFVSVCLSSASGKGGPKALSTIPEWGEQPYVHYTTRFYYL